MIRRKRRRESGRVEVGKLRKMKFGCIREIAPLVFGTTACGLERDEFVEKEEK